MSLLPDHDELPTVIQLKSLSFLFIQMGQQLLWQMHERILPRLPPVHKHKFIMISLLPHELSDEPGILREQVVNPYEV